MAFRILYHPEVKADVSRINKKLRSRIKKAIETRLMTSPQQYGEPLRKTLKGYWKLRVGDYRIVFKISGNELTIFGVIHRKTIYDLIGKRP
ncbi:MAG TPA: type II toxin-antitoxin system RelE/ParE family toxin [Nitrospirae bacterium]|nr:type II toxin-antitoxin system RelE/ParE family toxin [Nitrospirota bacterium]